MPSGLLTIHDGLLAGSRWRRLAPDRHGLRAAEIAVLMLMGAGAAAATAFLDFNLKIPGHSIIRAVLPIAFGLALVPRRLAGSVMGVAAALTAVGLNAAGWSSIGSGAMTSLCLTGPLLDVALRRAAGGWRLYLAFASAGLLSNLAAFVVRGSGKWLLFDPGSRAFGHWLSQAAVTYALCGLAAGFISALICFRFRADRRPSGRSSASTPGGDV